MTREWLKITSVVTVFMMLATGCATTRARKPATSAPDPNATIAQLSTELTDKDRRIAELEAKLAAYEDALPAARKNFTSSSRGKDSSGVIRVAGVSVKDLQGALSRAGFDPGPADGKLGKKTKSAVSDFQKSKGLKADGVVGQKTWTALNE